MNPPIVDQLIKMVDLESHLLPFLTYSGWELAENARWIVVHGEQDASNHPFELVFPKERTTERQDYILKAVELLAAISNEPIQLVLQGVINYDRDMLYVKNTVSDEEDAIALSLAVDQVGNLRRTIEYSACSEKEAKPYFIERPTIARKALRDFLFGHTFAGSFGFTVEAPRLPDPPKFIQQPLPIDEDILPPSVNVPFERRIVERIARGLIFAKQAEQERDPNILLREYTSGFNSQMCSAVAGMSRDKESTVEFRIAWSPKIKVDDDIHQFQPVRLRKEGYEILEYAAKQLKSIQPEYVEVVGHVRALTASDNPLSLETRRAIVVRGTYPGITRLIDVIVELDIDDYAKANEAHIAWHNVMVSGIINRSGTTWRLSDARGFKIIS